MTYFKKGLFFLAKLIVENGYFLVLYCLFIIVSIGLTIATFMMIIEDFKISFAETELKDQSLNFRGALTIIAVYISINWILYFLKIATKKEGEIEKFNHGFLIHRLGTYVIVLYMLYCAWSWVNDPSNGMYEPTLTYAGLLIAVMEVIKSFFLNLIKSYDKSSPKEPNSTA